MSTKLVILLVGLVPPLLLLAGCLRLLYLALAPVWYLLRRDYAGLERISQQTLSSWFRWVPTLRPAARYNLAFALHLRGELERAIEALKDLLQARLNHKLEYAAQALLGGTLVLAEREPAVARDLLTRALEITSTPNDYLMLAHVELELDRLDASRRAFEHASAEARGWTVRWSWATTLFRDQRLERDLYHLLSGWYLLKSGEIDSAREALSRVSRSPGDPYGKRADELLASLATTSQGS